MLAIRLFFGGTGSGLFRLFSGPSTFLPSMALLHWR